MTGVFISYRRSDTSAISGRLYDRLCQSFGRDNVFIDIDNIPYGADFLQQIDVSLKSTDVVLALIGKRWLGRRVGGVRQVFEATDFLRLELRSAFAHSRQVLPVLVGGAKMPSPTELPEDIRGLYRLNAAPLSEGQDFERHVVGITRAIYSMANRRVPGKIGFDLVYWSFEIEYRCLHCGYRSYIEKPAWQRDGERPPASCPKCGGPGYVPQPA